MKCNTVTMIPNLWKFWALLTLVFLHQAVECNACTISDLDRIGGRCTAQIDCEKEVDFDVKTWNCIKHTRREQYYDYSYGSRYREILTYDDTFYLVIYVKEPVETDSLLVNEQHFIKLVMEDGELVTVPEDVYKMNILVELKISGNKIGTVNLNNFLSMTHLINIALNNNMIRVIETEDDPSFELQISTTIQKIDLSNNLLRVLPNNFVSRFVQLQHLDLSHNTISNMGLLTFEGIVQLKTLDLSYNTLIEIGHALARFSNLKELSIVHNNITKIFAFNFATLSSLEKLNASSNGITTIEKSSFQTLIKLQELDLSHNDLIIISNQFFGNNININSIFLSDNEIQYIEENSFKATHLTTFCIKNNNLVGALKENTFVGVNVLELNLSGGNITSIEDGAFTDTIRLNNLNLSSNSISNLSFSAFSSLLSLNILDISYNQLKEFDFNSQSLKNLTKLYVHHNKIEKIIKNVFENFISLEELDLSFNDISHIEPGAILNLNNVIYFSIKNSNFVDILKSRALEGLTFLKKLDMSRTKTRLFQNESFSGLTSLTNFNYTSGQLAEIEYNAFSGTVVLEKLFLSNNQLQKFHVNTSNIAEIQEIHLNYNNIRNISIETFSHLSLLRILNLANNDIIKLSEHGFQDLIALTHLDLSSNKNMEVVGNPFQNLSRLYNLSLENVKWKTSFENSSASIEILNFKSCGINDVNKIYIFNIQGLSYVYLSMNEIATIDKHSFGNITSLVSLDLSLNKITYIQPGSFLYLKSLRNLNLYGNYLPSIQFGVFDGIEVLRELNLSSNVFSNFDVKLLPNTEKLFLDDNIIVDINLEDFLESSLSQLSIGGNQISCKALANLKVSKYAVNFKRIVTAKTLDYHSENVDGISCQTVTSMTPAANGSHVENNPNINISPLIATLRNVLDKLIRSLQIITENINANDNSNNKGMKVTKLLEDIIKINNNSQITNNKHLNQLSEISNSSSIQLNKYLNQLAEINNDSNVQLGEIKKYLKLFDSKKELEYGTSDTKSPIDDEYLRVELKKMLKQENDALREEFKNALASIVKDHPIHDSLIAHEKDSDDSKVVIYFMAACLAIMLSVYIGNIVFKQIITSRRSHNSHTRSSSTHITNSIEME